MSEFSGKKYALAIFLCSCVASLFIAQPTEAAVLYEDFEPGGLGGWTVIDNTGSGFVWHFDRDISFNDTGGTGRFAQAESDAAYDDVDTELRTPLMDLSCAKQVFLEFKTNAFLYFNDIADVDVSVNGAAGPWINVWQKTDAYAGSHTEVVDIASIAAGYSTVMVRFHYYNGFNDGQWQVDDVAVTASTHVLEHFAEPVVPTDWTVIDNTGSGFVWNFDLDASFNSTGGTGGFAQAESDAAYDDVDTELRTPLMDLSCANQVFLEFKTNVALYFNDIADVDVSVNGAAGPWINVWQKTDAYAGSHTEVVDITSVAAGHSTVMVRFHYYNGFNDGSWQIDNVIIETCGSCLSVICVPEPSMLALLSGGLGGLGLLARRRNARPPSNREGEAGPLSLAE